MDDFAAEMARFEAEMAGAGAFEATPAAQKLAPPPTAPPAQIRVAASAPSQPTISAVRRVVLLLQSCQLHCLCCSLTRASALRIFTSIFGQTGFCTFQCMQRLKR